MHRDQVKVDCPQGSNRPCFEQSKKLIVESPGWLIGCSKKQNMDGTKNETGQYRRKKVPDPKTEITRSKKQFLKTRSGRFKRLNVYVLKEGNYTVPK